ncbi:LysR family transcriptional regulator [Chitiniphilus shinanonensis]
MIATFIKVAELGSFNRTATQLGVSAAAVSKAIRQLEQHLGVRLFHRTTRKCALTEDGQLFFDSVKDNMAGLIASLNRTRNAAQDEEGLIRISAGGAVGRKVLMPLLAEFSQRYPGISFDLELEDGTTDTVIKRIDVGFKAGNAPTAQVVARRLFPIQLIVCAAPSYLATRSPPDQPADLIHHRCVGYRQPGTGRPVPWEFHANGETTYLHNQYSVCCSDPEAEMQAVIEGMGIGQIDSINAASAIRAGKLVPLLTDTVSERMGLYLFYAQRLDMPARVRRFIDFAGDRLRTSEDFYLHGRELSGKP